MIEDILSNFPLMAALAAVITAQVIKLPIHYITDGQLDFSRLFGTGGMPSSHSAFVVSLVTALILDYGWSHPLVAIAVVFGFIVMYDAAGVRRESGKQATMINALMQDMQLVSKEIQGIFGDPEHRRENLKELLGHEPIEIVVGAILGIGVALTLVRLY